MTESESRVQRTSGGAFVGAVLVTGLAALAAAAFWFVGRGRLVEDYCISRLDGGGGPTFSWPASMTCMQEDGSTVAFAEWQPLGWAVALSLVVAFIAVVAIRSAIRR